MGKEGSNILIFGNSVGTHGTANGCPCVFCAQGMLCIMVVEERFHNRVGCVRMFGVKDRKKDKYGGIGKNGK